VGEGRNILLRTAGKETFSENDLMLYEASWENPGELSGMLNWYRANLRLFLSLQTPAAGSIKTPTLMLWGEKDLALGKELAQPSIELCAEAVSFSSRMPPIGCSTMKLLQ